MRKTLNEVVDRTVDKAVELPRKIICDVNKEIQDDTKEAPDQSAKRADKVVDEVKAASVVGAEKTHPKQPEKIPPRDKPAEAAHGVPPAEQQEIPPHTGADSQISGTQDDRSVSEPIKDKSKPSASKATTSAKQSGSGAKQVKKDQRPDDKIAELFEFGHKVSKSIDDTAQEAFGLSLDEEKKVGGDVHKLVGTDQKILRAPALVQRLSKLAQPILEERARKEITFSFWVINSTEINAFSHVGGYIYVNKGLLDFIKSDAELQFILAHEIAHVDLKHVTKARQLNHSAKSRRKLTMSGTGEDRVS